MSTQYEQIKQAIEFLATRCDGAINQDNAGFNKPDSGTGHYLAERLARGGQLTPDEQQSMLVTLQKYRKQLAAGDIDLPEVHEYQAQPLTPKPAQPIKIEYSARIGLLIVTFPYDEFTKNQVSSLPREKRKFERQPTPRWLVNPDQLEELTRRLPTAVVLGTEALSTVEKPALSIVAPIATSTVAPPAKTTSPTISLDQDGKTLVVRFPYDPDMVTRIKTLDSTKWDPSRKAWLAPVRLIDQLIRIMPQASLSAGTQQVIKTQNELTQRSDAQTSNFDVPLATGALMPFQRAGVEFVNLANGNCLIGDDMGLGKTIQAIGYLQNHPELRPTVIVMPASVKINWQIEINKFMIINKVTQVISGQKTNKLAGSDIYLINYDILSYWLDELIALAPKIVIFDEVHKCKDRKAKRSKAAVELCKKTQHKIGLTGTPMLSRPRELWPILNMINPSAWPNFFAFGKKFCNGHQVQISRDGKMAWDFDGASNLDDLHKELKSIMIRRMKTNVLKELPPKRRVIVPIVLSTKELREYNTVLAEAEAAMEEDGNQAVQLAMIEKAKQAAVKAKMPYVLDWIADFLESTEKLVAFGVHREVTTGLHQEYADTSVCVIGGMNAPDRQSAVERFQNDPACQLFVGNIVAAGEGITLTAASNLAFMEYPWTPGLLKQAEDRIWRIGQDNAATIYQFVAIGTIEEEIVALLNKKAKVIDMAIDGQWTTDQDDLFAEIKAILRKRKANVQTM